MVEQMSNKASTDMLEVLHAQVAAELADVIKNGIEVIDKDGVVHRVPAPAAYLAQAIKFLKDNNIQAVAGEADMTELQRTLANLGQIPVAGEVPEEFKH